MSSIRVIRACLALAILVITGCTNGNSRTIPGPQRLVIEVTGNVAGTVEPCGCYEGQLGGLAKRAWITSESRRLNPDGYLLLDYGNLLFPAQPSNGFDSAQRLLRARLLAQGTAKLKLDAYNLSVPDFEQGQGAAIQLLRAGGVPIVSANLQDSGGRPLAPGFLSFSRRGLRIAVTGVSEPLNNVDPLPEGIRVSPPIEALDKLFPVLRRDHDLVVILSHVRRPTAAEVEKKFAPAIVLGAQYDQMGVVTTATNDQVISAGSTTRGRHLGRLTLDFAPGTSTFSKMETTADGQRPAFPKPHAGSGFRFDLVPIAPKTTEDPGLRTAIDAMKREMVAQSVTDFGQTAALNAANERPGFAGAQSCKSCHQVQYEYWSGHAHAHAMDTLRKTNNHTDATCIGCHSLGYRSPDGYLGTVVPKFFENVQCESCHGQAGLHVENVLGSKPVRKVAEQTCMGCHGAFHEEKPFDYKKMLPRASCPSARPLEPSTPTQDQEGGTGEPVPLAPKPGE